MRFGKGVVLHGPLFLCVEVFPEVFPERGITSIHKGAMNAAGHQCRVDIDYILPESLIIPTNGTAKIISVVFLDYFNTMALSVIYDLRAEDDADIVQVIPLAL